MEMARAETVKKIVMNYTGKVFKRKNFEAIVQLLGKLDVKG